MRAFNTCRLYMIAYSFVSFKAHFPNDKHNIELLYNSIHNTLSQATHSEQFTQSSIGSV